MIHIFHISDGEKHFSEAVSEYIGRLGKMLEIHTIKPIKHTESMFIRRAETKKLIEKLDKIHGTIVLCDERGDDMSTTRFSDMLQNAKNTSENLVFIIGGSYGVDIDTLRIGRKIILLRLSHFVMPHGLALLVLIEQIYRAKEIEKGSGYHHG